ncbi:glycoprotein A33 [Nothobranchius furzeri]|uniref:Glycoprotein A33 n=1 Tax=Nothobranchius furzeri TaxID=105023 RepID=A0A9D3BPX4_NOTFU|nr:glycoprotein A33 [Nothobranchius furzeri]
MISRRQLSWQKLSVFFTVLPCCWSLQVSIQNKEYKVTKGGEVALVCSFIPAAPVESNFILTWDAHPDVTGDPLKPVATYILNNPVRISPSYEGRASVEVDIPKGKSTLHLTKVTMQDNRHYQCNIRILEDDEGTTAASTFLLVLEPPSQPVCTLQGSAEYFHNITLTCKSQEGSPQPVYQWATYSVENIPREFPPKTTQNNGVLSLFNISRDSSGFFICLSSNEIGSASCNFTLAVMPSSMKLGSTAGIIGGVVAGIVVLGIIIFCGCCRKKGKSKENAEDSPKDMVFYDKDGLESGEPYLDDRSKIEKNLVEQFEDKYVAHQSQDSILIQKDEDDQNSYISSKKIHDEKGSDLGSHQYQEEQQKHCHRSQDRRDDHGDHYGSRDCLEDRRDYYGSRDRLEGHRDHYGSRDRLEDRRDHYGSRDCLDNRRDHYGSRDRLEDSRDHYGSRDRLEDSRDHYGSRDRLEDSRDHYGSRDRLEDSRDHYGSRDRLEDSRDHYGSRDRLDDRHDHYGSRDRLDDRHHYGSRDHLDNRHDRYGSQDHLESR